MIRTLTLALTFTSTLTSIRQDPDIRVQSSSITMPKTVTNVMMHTAGHGNSNGKQVVSEF